MIDVVRCSYADVMRDPEYFAWKFLHDGVFGIRGLYATEEQQLDIILSIIADQARDLIENGINNLHIYSLNQISLMDQIINKLNIDSVK